MNYAIEMKNITKCFGDKKIINDVSLSVKKGEIYGFLGPNGAGKTSLMKIILNLLMPDIGIIKIFGEEMDSEYDCYRKIGSIIETPIFYENMTAKKNLEIHCDYIDEKYKQNIDQIFSVVGLEGEEEKLVKRYSLGMKQRLAIGRALLTEPQILILDEPTNGLDPQGIVQFRELIKEINEKNETSIIVSSHILAEIEKIADTIGIIYNGVMLEQVSMIELERSHGNLEDYYLDLIHERN